MHCDFRRIHKKLREIPEIGALWPTGFGESTRLTLEGGAPRGNNSPAHRIYSTKRDFNQ
jgi:hypothetical protein